MMHHEFENILRHGTQCHTSGRLPDALQAWNEGVRHYPHSPPLWNNRGTTLLALKRFEEAAASYLRALELQPDLHNSRTALATCFQALGRPAEALSACEQVIQVVPDHAEAHWNRALLLLLLGDYQRGWDEYEWRWKRSRPTSPLRNFPFPAWCGENLNNKKLLVYSEQGYGDTIQFCRYLPLLAASGITIIFECPAALVPLMASLSCANLGIIPAGQKIPPCDAHVALLSLPRIMATTEETIPAKTQYLRPPRPCVDNATLTCLPDSNIMRIGLCWRGKQRPDPLRSCPAHVLAPLAAAEDVAWYAVFVEPETEMPDFIRNPSPTIRDFGDTAAIVSGLDLVISIDTASAHLAGALGKDTWLMLPFSPDWRWSLERSDSPWYPTMRIFRQDKPGDWPGVIQRIAAALQERRELLT